MTGNIEEYLPLPPSFPPFLFLPFPSTPLNIIGMADHLTLTLGGAGYKAYKCTWMENGENGKETRKVILFRCVPSPRAPKYRLLVLL